MELSYEELEDYTGTIYEVVLTIYEDEEPWFEEGTIENAYYDNEEEAKDAYVAQRTRGDLEIFFSDYSDVPEYDTVGVFLLERVITDGRFADTYFTDDIIDMYTVHR